MVLFVYVVVVRPSDARANLFFFTSFEFIRERRPQNVRYLTVPTSLERQGDFSQSVGNNGRAVVINDPAAGKTPFPRNVIPKARIHPATQAYLNLLPMPNAMDSSITRFAYNYTAQESLRAPKMLQTTRIDYNANPNTMLWFRYN